MFIGVQLKPAYRWWNFLAIPLTTTTITYVGTFVNVAALFLLKDPEFFNIPENEIGRTTNDIVFYSQLIQVFFVLAIGYVYDLCGRRVTICSTLFVAALFVALIPNTAPSIELLITLRIGMVVALSALGSHPFTNDYVHKSTRGRAIAFQSAGVIIGDLLTFLVMLNLTRNMTGYGRFQVFGFSLAVIAALFFLIVKEPTIKQKSQPDIEGSFMPSINQESHNKREGMISRARNLTSTVLTLCKSDIVFPICLFGTLTTRTVHFLFGTFLMLYVTSEISDRLEAESVLQKANIISVIATVIIIMPAGRIADKLSARVLIPIAFTLVATALIAFQYMPPPKEGLLPLYVVVTFIMLGSVLAMTSIETAYARNLPKDVRGIMNSVQTFFGTCGALMFTKFGGYMFDMYGPKSPFLIVAAVNICFAAFVAMAGLTGKFKH